MSWAGISGIKASQPPSPLKLGEKKTKTFSRCEKIYKILQSILKLLINSSDSKYLFLRKHDFSHIVMFIILFQVNLISFKTIWNHSLVGIGFQDANTWEQYSHVTVVQIFPVPHLLRYIVQSKYYSKKTRMPTMWVDCLQGQIHVALELPRMTWIDA